MNELTFYRAIVGEIRKRIAEESEAVASGHAMTWDDYKRRTGRIAAFQEDLTLIKELLRKFYDGEIVEEVFDE